MFSSAKFTFCFLSELGLPRAEQRIVGLGSGARWPGWFKSRSASYPRRNTGKVTYFSKLHLNRIFLKEWCRGWHEPIYVTALARFLAMQVGTWQLAVSVTGAGEQPVFVPVLLLCQVTLQLPAFSFPFFQKPTILGCQEPFSTAVLATKRWLTSFSVDFGFWVVRTPHSGHWARM